MNEIAVTITLPAKNCYDVLTTAAEGGSNYWLIDSDGEDFIDAEVKRNEQNLVVLIAFTGKDGKHYTISPAEIAVAWTRIIKCEAKVREDLVRMVAALACAENCNIDAEGADVLVQVAAFGEVRYG
jgi:hypothetical protein